MSYFKLFSPFLTVMLPDSTPLMGDARPPEHLFFHHFTSLGLTSPAVAAHPQPLFQQTSVCALHFAHLLLGAALPVAAASAAFWRSRRLLVVLSLPTESQFYLLQAFLLCLKQVTRLCLICLHPARLSSFGFEDLLPMSPIYVFNFLNGVPFFQKPACLPWF